MCSSTGSGSAAGPALKLKARLAVRVDAMVLKIGTAFRQQICGASVAGRPRSGPHIRITELPRARLAVLHCSEAHPNLCLALTHRKFRAAAAYASCFFLDNWNSPVIPTNIQ